MKSPISTSYFGWNSVTAVWINPQHPDGSISLLYQLISSCMMVHMWVTVPFNSPLTGVTLWNVTLLKKYIYLIPFLNPGEKKLWLGQMKVSNRNWVWQGNLWWSASHSPLGQGQWDELQLILQLCNVQHCWPATHIWWSLKRLFASQGNIIHS